MLTSSRLDKCPTCGLVDVLCDDHERCWSCHTVQEKQRESDDYIRAGRDHYDTRGGTYRV
jgi:hypothetical protein